MNKTLRIICIFLASFVAIFTLNGLLSMDSTHGFFYVTPVKIVIRIITAAIITNLIASKLK